jgi:ABC-type proline/glycine betaine transport system permease subunit
VLGAAICIAALALVIEFLLALVQRALTPQGLKLSAADEPAVAFAPVAATDVA